MKKQKNYALIALLIPFLIALLFSGISFGQNVTRDSKGNFVAAKAQNDTATAKLSTYTFTGTKGEILPVYVSKNGKYFIIRVSAKTGNSYKQYLKP